MATSIGLAASARPSLGRTGWLVLIIAVGLVPAWGSPYHVTVAFNLCVTLVLTLSLDFVVGRSGQFHLSHVAFFGTGAYVSAILAKAGLSPWLCLPCAMGAVALLAAIIGLPVTRLKGLYLAVATLSFSLFVEVVVKQGGPLTGGGYGIQDIPPPEFFGTKLVGSGFYLVALAALVATIVILRNLIDSKFGREVIATRDSPDTAEASGIHPASVRLAVLIIAAVLAATAGWLHAFYHRALDPSLLSPEWTFLWFFMVLVGGMGSTLGVALGTILLSLVPEMLGFATGQTILGVGALMILVTLFAPRGLGGLLEDFARRRPDRRGRRVAIG
jgi:branched-chain amino acid transport system permease protein